MKRHWLNDAISHSISHQMAARLMGCHSPVLTFIGFGTCVIGSIGGIDIVINCIVINIIASHAQVTREGIRLVLEFVLGDDDCDFGGSGVAIIIGVIIISCC